ncbi:APC family permease [Streptomyces sp. NBC_01306]|uniref:APC family permease n=1 Tax=Streptomyces sp. NBC_01306 TaxID=2903819 RepID=UPI00224F223D|nr:APC family permease [Streptomyces sp. NBC_01306]MCX4729346.1 APC family permease [Streptomyces sp. NBC_01306]
MTASTGTGIAAETSSGQGLRANAISTRDLVFFVVAAAAPLTVLAGFLPMVFLLSGNIAPVGYLIAGIVYALFAVGFTAMSRHVQDAGAFYAYIRLGLGEIIGSGAALVAYVGYTLGQIGFCAAAGLFASNALDTFLGLHVPWGVSAVVLGITVGVLSYCKVDIGARVLAVLLLAEVGILFVLAVAIIATGAPEGYSLTSFNPTHWHMSALGPLLVLTFIVYIGFEQTAIYSEEARDARRTVPRATYIAVGLLTVVYAFMSWIILMGIGPTRLASAVSSDPTNVIFNINRDFVGSRSTDVMQILVVTSFFAGVLALQNAGTRYLYTMAREGLVPQKFTRTSPTSGSPTTAAIAQAAISVIAIAVFAQLRFDPYTQVVIWTNTPTLLAVLLLQIGTSVAAVLFFRKHVTGESLWHRWIAPALSALLLSGVLVLVTVRLDLLTGLGIAGNTLICIPLILAFIFGAARGRHVRRLRRSGEPS